MSSRSRRAFEMRTFGTSVPSVYAVVGEGRDGYRFGLGSDAAGGLFYSKGGFATADEAERAALEYVDRNQSRLLFQEGFGHAEEGAEMAKRAAFEFEIPSAQEMRDKAGQWMFHGEVEDNVINFIDYLYEEGMVDDEGMKMLYLAATRDYPNFDTDIECADDFIDWMEVRGYASRTAAFGDWRDTAWVNDLGDHYIKEWSDGAFAEVEGFMEDDGTRLYGWCVSTFDGSPLLGNGFCETKEQAMAEAERSYEEKKQINVDRYNRAFASSRATRTAGLFVADTPDELIDMLRRHTDLSFDGYAGGPCIVGTERGGVDVSFPLMKSKGGYGYAVDPMPYLFGTSSEYNEDAWEKVSAKSAALDQSKLDAAVAKANANGEGMWDISVEVDGDDVWLIDRNEFLDADNFMNDWIWRGAIEPIETAVQKMTGDEYFYFDAWDFAGRFIGVVSPRIASSGAVGKTVKSAQAIIPTVGELSELAEGWGAHGGDGDDAASFIDHLYEAGEINLHDYDLLCDAVDGYPRLGTSSDSSDDFIGWLESEGYAVRAAAKTAQGTTNDGNFAIGDTYEYWPGGPVFEITEIDGNSVFLECEGDPDFPLWAESDELRRELEDNGVYASRTRSAALQWDDSNPGFSTAPLGDVVLDAWDDGDWFVFDADGECIADGSTFGGIDESKAKCEEWAMENGKAASKAGSVDWQRGVTDKVTGQEGWYVEQYPLYAVIEEVDGSFYCYLYDGPDMVWSNWFETEDEAKEEMESQMGEYLATAGRARARRADRGDKLQLLYQEYMSVYGHVLSKEQADAIGHFLDWLYETGKRASRMAFVSDTEDWDVEDGSMFYEGFDFNVEATENGGLWDVVVYYHPVGGEYMKEVHGNADSQGGVYWVAESIVDSLFRDGLIKGGAKMAKIAKTAEVDEEVYDEALERLFEKYNYQIGLGIDIMNMSYKGPVDLGVNWAGKGTKTVAETREFANKLLEACNDIESFPYNGERIVRTYSRSAAMASGKGETPGGISYVARVPSELVNGSFFMEVADKYAFEDFVDSVGLDAAAISRYIEDHKLYNVFSRFDGRVLRDNGSQLVIQMDPEGSTLELKKGASRTAAWDWAPDDGFSGAPTHYEGQYAYAICAPGEYFDDGWGVQVFDLEDLDDGLFEEFGPFDSEQEAKEQAEHTPIGLYRGGSRKTADLYTLETASGTDTVEILQDANGNWGWRWTDSDGELVDEDFDYGDKSVVEEVVTDGMGARKASKKADLAQISISEFKLNGETAYEGSLCDGEYWFEIYPDGNGWETRVVHEDEPRDDEFAFGYGATPEQSLQGAVDEMKGKGVAVTASAKRVAAMGSDDFATMVDDAYKGALDYIEEGHSDYSDVQSEVYSYVQDWCDIQGIPLGDEDEENAVQVVMDELEHGKLVS